MPTYSVIDVAKDASGQPAVRPWDSGYGPMVAYTMTLRNQAGVEAVVEWSRKPDSRPPSVGQSLEGKVENGPKGLKFKTTPSQGGGRGGGGNQGPRETHPRDAARMGMHGSIGHALTYLDIKARAGNLNVDGVKPNDVLAVAEVFAQAINEAGAKA